MVEEELFRWILVVTFVLAFGISGYYRHKARRSGETIPRSRESAALITTKIVGALLLYLPLLAYMVNPRWMAWSQMPLPASVRWLGAALGATCIPLIYWVVSSLGRNISETIFTKRKHELVTHGPYRWVRHPLYTVAMLLFLGFALLMASWFVAAMIVLAAGMIRFIKSRAA